MGARTIPSRESALRRGTPLPPNFKLHCNELRQNAHPHDQISRQECRDLADVVFGAMRSIGCSLVSATAHKPSHTSEYPQYGSAGARTLLVRLERFGYFLGDRGDGGRWFARGSLPACGKGRRGVACSSFRIGIPTLCQPGQNQGPHGRRRSYNTCGAAVLRFFRPCAPHQDGRRAQAQLALGRNKGQALLRGRSAERARVCCDLRCRFLGLLPGRPQLLAKRNRDLG